MPAASRQLVSGACGGGEARHGVAVVVGRFADGCQRGRLANPGESLQAVDSIAGGQYLLDDTALGRV